MFFLKKVCGFVDIEFNYQYKKNTYIKSYFKNRNTR